jgi:branched-chain amino acid transport system permease protein
MSWWKRVGGSVLTLVVLLAFNAWATMMFQAVTTRPDLQQIFIYKQFAVFYPVGLEIGRWIILAVSLNLVNGVAGQFSLGHAAFSAIGGYASAAITVYLGPRLLGSTTGWYPGAAPLGWNLLFGVSLLVGGLVAAGAGFLIGIPSLRLRGDYLAIVTLGFGEVVRVVIEHIEPVGGSLGFNGVPLITNYFWMFLAVVVTILVVRNVVQSGPGRALHAIREDEIAAEAMGVPLTRYKVTAFVIGAFLAGLAGGLFAHKEGTIQPQAAGFSVSNQIVVMVVLGGSGSITGSVLAAILLTLLPEIIRTVKPEWEPFRMPLYALLLIVLMLTRPQGLLGGKEFSVRALFAKRKREIGTELKA